MRLLCVSHLYPRKDISSAGVFIHRLNRGLRALGVDVHVLQLAEWAPPWPMSALLPAWRESRERRRTMRDTVDGIPVHHPETFTPRPSRFFSGDVWDRDVRALVSYCRRRGLGRADAVIGHFMVPDGYHAMHLARALDLPVAAMAWGDDVHAWPEERDYWRRRLIEVLSGVDRPIGCAARIVRDGNSWLAHPRADWSVVYGGVDLERFRPAVDVAAHRRRALPDLPAVHASRAKVLLMLAQPVTAKGYIELLDAWAATAPSAPDWHLVMAGANWGNVDVPAEARARGLDERAHWIGPREAESVPELLRASDAFVLPSHNEGLSLSMLEALASGLPTVATDVGGHAEVIRSADEGWLVPPRDVPSLGAALRELTGSEEARARRARHARLAAERIGSPDANARHLLAALEALIAHHPRRRSPVRGPAPVAALAL